MNYIINPNNNQKYSLSSNEGRNLLRKYIYSSYQQGSGEKNLGKKKARKKNIKKQPVYKDFREKRRKANKERIRKRRRFDLNQNRGIQQPPLNPPKPTDKITEAIYLDPDPKKPGQMEVYKPPQLPPITAIYDNSDRIPSPPPISLSRVTTIYDESDEIPSPPPIPKKE